MTRIGYHASHEQYAPGELLRLVQRADAAGFGSGMCSDHFHPWGEQQGHSGFAWSWLGAALQATSLSFGVVTVPGGWRYNPAIIAQAAATLAEMFPGRFWIAPGSGELLNEGITGQRWPTKAERNARLREGVDIIRALWSGETVTHHGLITVEEARIYSLPREPPKIVGAALSPRTAEWMGGWADGMITVAGPRESMQEMIDAFRRGGGEGKPVYLQAQLSYARTEEEALHGAWEQWRTVKLPSPVLSDLRLPAQFDALGEGVSKEDVKEKMRVSADVERHLEWLAGDVEMGFEEINLHCVHREQQERFIDVFGERVLPRLAGTLT
jgi:coenzyme F420-dependent glucose-6-phosphate dehydrogenase